MSFWKALFGDTSRTEGRTSADVVVDDTTRMRQAISRYSPPLIAIDYEIRDGEGRLKDSGYLTYD